MNRRHRRTGEGRPRALEQPYEGRQVLESLLEAAGSPHKVDEVTETFRIAQAKGERRGDAIPTLFPREPRFDSPEDAKRLYGNLFALWDRVAAGVAEPADTPVPEALAAVPSVPRPVPPLPPRGEAVGEVLPSAVVEATWKHLDALPSRELKRLRDRFESAQPDLVAWLDAQPLDDEAAVVAADLAFETWAMFDVAFGDRVEAAPFKELRAREAEPPTIETTQPALAAYVEEALELVAEEDPEFGVPQRAQVERVVAAVASALAEALAPEDDA